MQSKDILGIINRRFSPLQKKLSQKELRRLTKQQGTKKKSNPQLTRTSNLEQREERLFIVLRGSFTFVRRVALYIYLESWCRLFIVPID